MRVLASDLGTLLGGGAHLKNLRRTAIGHFKILDGRDHSVASASVLHTKGLFSHLEDIQVDGQTLKSVQNGNPLSSSEWEKKEGLFLVISKKQEVLALYKSKPGASVATAAVVLRSAMQA